ncbi:IgGFc-binding protein [Paludibacter sp.]|uniref:IgGFc-binding protein n=1 Tax=Paludibacter sp. TaxID=1898105 RepID=UPI00135321FA|nr:IgGFc-binding protein [Paludibacter sp.]MTK52941.1 hypothetical protein [Paludibacter sp.]
MVNKRTSFILALVLVQCFICVSNCVQAQTSKTFWFVAPDLSSGHEESPILFRLVNGNAVDAKVTISQPANPSGFTPITLTVPHNSLSSCDLTTFLGLVEDSPDNNVNNKGLLITSDQYISVYYEENGSNNPAIYALKGDNALGTSFLIPGQNLLDNVTTVNPKPYNSFHIVAASDNTRVTITPQNAISGHAAGVPFTITLNKGQTYAAVATSQLAANHLGGSRVTSDKPVAITICDDSMYGAAIGGTCYNEGGDQIIPLSLLGQEYIAVRGNFGVGISSFYGDQVFVMATQPNTDIYINGSKTTTITNVGEIYRYNMTQSENACYIKANKNISVLQMSGFGCETDFAVLAQLSCTGSREVTLARSTSDNYYLTVLVEAGGEGNFTISTSSGAGATLTASDFNPVPGTGGKYLYARKSFTTAQIPQGATVTLKNNTNKFHVGIIHGTSGSGCRFGYFSEYSSSQARFDPRMVYVCQGNPINLTPTFTVSRTVDPSSVLYSWDVPDGMGGRQSFPPSNATPSYQVPSASLAQSGAYIVHVSADGCDATDTATVKVLNSPLTGVKTVTVYTNELPYEWNGKKYRATGDYPETLVSVLGGCDSIVTLKLTVSPDFSATMKASPQICANDKNFTLSYDVAYGTVDYHSVVFDSKAQQAGFVDILKQSANGYIDVPLPSGVTPDTYNASVIFENSQVTKTQPVSFTVNYSSSIILQKWNDVLALLNSSYNGGYDFSVFQWYKNGQVIDGATESYLYIENGQLDTNAQYQVKVTRAVDGVSLFTCPFQPTLHTDVLVYPTLLSRGSPVTIKMDEKGSGLLLNISGLKIKQQALNPGENSMRAPDSAGTYVLVLTNSKGESKKQLLIVK